MTEPHAGQLEGTWHYPFPAAKLLDRRRWDMEALPHLTEDELLAAAHAFVTNDGTYYGPLTVGRSLVGFARTVRIHSDGVGST